MLFGRIRVFTILLSLLLVIWNFFGVSGLVLAQSLLSDRVWLEQKINVFIEKDLTEQNRYARFSGMMHAPLILNQSVARPLAPEKPELLYPIELPPKPSLSQIQKDELTNESSISHLSRIFPWVPSMELTTADTEADSNQQDQEWANNEFVGFSMPVAEIEEMIFSDPEAAREKYLEFENWLKIEDRVKLKVQLLYHLNKWASAEKLAIAFLKERPRSPIIPLIYYYLNKSLHSQNKPLDQDQILRDLALTELSPKPRGDLLLMFSNEAQLKGEILAAIQYRLELLSNSETSDEADLEKIALLIKEVQSPEELRILLVNYPDSDWLQEQIFEIEIELFSKQRRYSEALVLLDQRLNLAREIGNEKQYKRLEKIQRSFVSALNVSPGRIGVILPMSSSNVKIVRLVQETLNGLRLALHANKINALNDNPDNSTSLEKTVTENSGKVSENGLSGQFEDSWELVIRDSHLDPQKTKNAIRELVEIERVIAIIGPLARKTSEAAAEEAERLSVPLISLSLTDSIPEYGEYIFRNNQSWRQEVQKLADYATDKLQACRFLILYAQTREGRQKMRLFWNAVQQKGCEVVAAEGFKDEGQKSLVNEFDTFTGKIKRIGTTDKSILKELKEKEDPVHNFDAVYVAVGAGGVKNLRLILPYSAVYKMRKTKFLGDSGWNDSALPFSPGVSGVRKPVFADSFFLGSKTKAMGQLKRIHEQILYRHQNYIGPSSYTAHAYDTLMILMQLLNDERNQSHRDLKEALKNMKSFQGVTGKLKFDDVGEAKREIHLLTLHRGKIQPLN